MASGKLYRLSAVGVPKIKKQGMHPDGGGLYLQIAPSGARSWIFRFRMHGGRRDMGLGSASVVTLAEAREKADAARRAAAAGIDPIGARERAEAELVAVRAGTFRALALALVEAKEGGWRNAKHKAQWRATLEAYAFPTLGDKVVGEIGVGDVEAVLRPIWLAKPETARRVRQRIGAVLDYAIARGARRDANPARPEILRHVLPRQKAAPKHHAALPYADVAAFMRALSTREAVAARALEFAILTAARSGEVRGAKWREIDMAARVWVVPSDRIKAGREHRVPLSGRAIEILAGMAAHPGAVGGQPDPDAFVFPGASKSGALSENALTELLDRMGRSDITAHGFRSTFRDWAAERTNFAREIAEKALAHIVGNEAERAYQRGDLLEKRRAMMEAWSAFCSAPPTQSVLVLAGRRRSA